MQRGQRRNPAKLVLLCVAAGCLCIAAATEGPAQTVDVFAAASLTEPFTAMGAALGTARPNLTVRFNFAASSTLVRQISDGAPADVFAAADEATMQQLADAGEVAGAVRIFATNRLAIAVPPGNPQHIATLADLGRRGLTLALAAPAVPAGKYAAAAFAKAGLPIPSASQEPDVRAVLNKVALGEADAGIVYATDARAAAGRVEAVTIPAADNVVARYPIAVLRHAADPAGAAAFVDIVLSDAGQQRLASYGFAPP
jgi:molybdate transport system substrate-binding protein